MYWNDWDEPKYTVQPRLIVTWDVLKPPKSNIIKFHFLINSNMRCIETKISLPSFLPPIWLIVTWDVLKLCKIYPRNSKMSD